MLPTNDKDMPILFPPEDETHLVYLRNCLVPNDTARCLCHKRTKSQCMKKMGAQFEGPAKFP